MAPAALRISCRIPCIFLAALVTSVETSYYKPLESKALVIYDTAHVFEYRWISFLFGGAELPSISDIAPSFPNCTVNCHIEPSLPNCTIFVTAYNSPLFSKLATYPNSQSFMWVQLSDESRGSHIAFANQYARWHSVSRNYWSNDDLNTYDRLEARGKLFWFPLGYGYLYATQHLPLTSSLHLLSFVGNLGNNALRAKHIQEIAEKGNISVYGATADKSFGTELMNASAFAGVLRDSSFCLSLPGASAECFRFYESLQCGCIPVIVDEFSDADYTRRNWHEFKHLLALPASVKSHRIKPARWKLIFNAGQTQYQVPFFWVKSVAGLHVLNMLSEADKYELRQESTRWWNCVKNHFRTSFQTYGSECQKVYSV